MDKSTWLKHWHNIRSSSKPRDYGVPIVVLIRFNNQPYGEMAYGWERGHMSKMQQPFMRKRQCPECGIFRKVTDRYIYWQEDSSKVSTCRHCRPDCTPCPHCGGLCSTHELQLCNGVCVNCYSEEESYD